MAIIVLPTNQNRKNYLWLIFQISIVVLPWFPALGELGLVIVLINIWRSHFWRFFNSPLNWGWFALSFWLIINSIIAEQPVEAALGLANFLPFFALYIAVGNLVDNYYKLSRLAWLLILSSIPIVILGLGQLYFNWSFSGLIANILGWELVAQGIPLGRMSSVFIYANFLAIYLVFSFILTLGLWLNYWAQNPQKKYILIFLTFSLIVNIIGLILANSRNSWLIVFIACLAFALYLNWYWLVSGITAIVTIIFGASFGDFTGQGFLRKIVPEFIWGRLSDRIYPDRPVETLRLSQWQFCWQKIQERPLTGWGLRNFTPLYLAETNFWFGHPHNFFLMLSLEIGLIATIFFCLLVSYSLIKQILYFFVQSQSKINPQEQLMIFTYLIAFLGCLIFNLFDVTIFDLRINTITWIIFAAISGIKRNSSQLIQP